MTATAKKNFQQSDLKALSDADLKRYLRRCLEEALDNLNTSAERVLALAVTYQEALRRGTLRIDVGDYHKEMGRFLVAMAEGRLKPMAFIKALGNTSVLDRLLLLSPARQEKVVEDGIEVVVANKVITRPVEELSAREAALAISPVGRLRSIPEQRKHIEETAAPVKFEPQTVEISFTGSQYASLVRIAKERGVTIPTLIKGALVRDGAL